MNNMIDIIGAKNNNLKDISLSIPKGKITVVVGVSGSGKSSLVFDTLAAESQRLLSETYSSYIRQMLPQYEPPNVDKISNLPVSIVINQKAIGGNIRSTVGTITDIYAGLRLLYARIGKPFIGYSMFYSFNNPQGMCKTCEGLGEVRDIDIDALIDFELSLNEGAVQFPTFQPGGFRLSRYTESGNFDNDKKIKDYTEEELTLLLYDTGSKPKKPTDKFPKTSNYIGVVERIKGMLVDKSASKNQKDFTRIFDVKTCPDCHGTRVNERVRSVKIQGLSIGDCVQMSIKELIAFLEGIENPKVKIIVQDLLVKCHSLLTVGLGYLTLGRTTNSLSGGESQRIKMTKHLHSALSDVLYIFDEPSVGLHPEDICGINNLFESIKDKGNTVVIVDHDPDVIKIADYIIELGPRAGSKGGYITFKGEYSDLLASSTDTGITLRQKHNIIQSKLEIKEYYTLQNVSAYNIHNQSIKIPKNALSVITGVAGAGKSTLIRKLFVQKYSEAIVFDQKPIHGSNRSNLLTYLGAFDKVRQFFADVSHKSPSLFSFNGKGACPECKGKGIIKYDLAFLGDTKQVCEKCHGKRYNDEALAIVWKGRNINDILQLTVEEAYDIMESQDIQKVLQALMDVNLGYMTLGQSLDTLSGGEIQRIKIAKSLLSIMNRSSEIYILDEPSTGLHEKDIIHLLTLMQRLKDRGKTLIIMEHNLSIIAQADWIIDIGPKGGNQGGKVLFEGYPIDLLKQENSYTARHLRKFITM